MSARIRQLEQFIVEDPADPFNHYALGLEYANIDTHRALQIFEHLIDNHREYLPVYYQLAKLYERLGQIKNASDTFTNGIAIAKQQMDLKTLRELNAGLEELDGL